MTALQYMIAFFVGYILGVINENAYQKRQNNGKYGNKRNS